MSGPHFGRSHPKSSRRTPAVYRVDPAVVEPTNLGRIRPRCCRNQTVETTTRLRGAAKPPAVEPDPDWDEAAPFAVEACPRSVEPAANVAEPAGNMGCARRNTIAQYVDLVGVWGNSKDAKARKPVLRSPESLRGMRALFQIFEICAGRSFLFVHNFIPMSLRLSRVGQPNSTEVVRLRLNLADFGPVWPMVQWFQRLLGLFGQTWAEPAKPRRTWPTSANIWETRTDRSTCTQILGVSIRALRDVQNASNTFRSTACHTASEDQKRGGNALGACGGSAPGVLHRRPS